MVLTSSTSFNNNNNNNNNNKSWAKKPIGIATNHDLESARPNFSSKASFHPYHSSLKLHRISCISPLPQLHQLDLSSMHLSIITQSLRAILTNPKTPIFELPAIIDL